VQRLGQRRIASRGAHCHRCGRRKTYGDRAHGGHEDVARQQHMGTRGDGGGGEQRLQLDVGGLRFQSMGEGALDTGARQTGRFQ
jgi:hypothetical protein